MVAVAQREHRQHYPRPGWVEHDADGDLAQRRAVVPAALRSAGLARRTSSRWASPTSARPPSSGTGAPASRSARRSPGRTRARTRDRGPAVDDGHGHARHRAVRPAAGHLLRRAAAALAARPRRRGCAPRAERGDVLFGTMESWLIWNLTGGPDGGVHVTDVTNASRTMLMDICDPGRGTTELLDVLRRAARAMLPEIRPNAEVYGTCATVLPGVPIAGGARRPAGGALRADLLRARRGQVHLRHGRVPADEHRPADRPVDARADPDGRLRVRPTPRCTRWRARSRSPGRWCSGSATRSG